MPAADLVFYVALSFLVGIFLAGLDIGLFYVLLLSAIFLGIIYTLKKAKLKYLIIFAAVIFLGLFYFNFRINLTAERERAISAAVDFSGIVVGEPQSTDRSQRLILSLNQPLAGRIQIIAAPFPRFHYGDFLEIDGRIDPAERVGSLPTAVFPRIEVVAEHRGFGLKEKMFNLKTAFESQFKNFLPPDAASLLGGLTFGTRSEFGQELKNQMRLSGTTHLVALSGYNIAILVIAIGWVCGYFFSRRIAFFLTTAIIVIFVMMVGATPSVIRAAIMGFLLLLAKETGRFYDMRNAVTITAFLMVLLNPIILNFDLGFIFSFASLLGIVYLSPAVNKFFGLRDDKGGSFLGWRENAVMTLSAQLTVLPIIVHNFGQFSFTAVLANILILEFVPLTMFLGFLLAAIGPIFYALGFLISKIVYILLAYEIGIIKFFANLRLPITADFNSWPIIIAYYLAIIAFIVYFSQNVKNDKKS